MQSHSSYIDLFRQIATLHVEINHSENWEEGDGEMHFGRIIRSGSNPFDATGDIKEFLATYKDDLKFPCLLVETRLINFQNRNVPEKRNNCSFYILSTTGDQNDFDSQEEAIDKSEKIATEVLAYIQTLSKANGGFYYNPETSEIDAFGPVTDSIYGVRADLELKISKALCYDPDRFDLENYDACEWFENSLTAAQKNCLTITLITGGLEGSPTEGAIGIFVNGGEEV